MSKNHRDAVVLYKTHQEAINYASNGGFVVLEESDDNQYPHWVAHHHSTKVLYVLSVDKDGMYFWKREGSRD